MDKLTDDEYAARRIRQEEWRGLGRRFDAACRQAAVAFERFTEAYREAFPDEQIAPPTR